MNLGNSDSKSFPFHFCCCWLLSIPFLFYRSETQREAYSYNSDIRRYSGGGYELKMKGQIAKLKHKLSVLQNNDWIDNRTRALITEFSVYNPQVKQFPILKMETTPG